MCYNRHHLIVTTVESVNRNGERHRIYTQLVQYSQIVIFFLQICRLTLSMESELTIQQIVNFHLLSCVVIYPVTDNCKYA
jgi:hypothetical protein